MRANKGIPARKALEDCERIGGRIPWVFQVYKNLEILGITKEETKIYTLDRKNGIML